MVGSELVVGSRVGSSAGAASSSGRGRRAGGAGGADDAAPADPNGHGGAEGRGDVLCRHLQRAGTAISHEVRGNLMGCGHGWQYHFEEDAQCMQKQSAGKGDRRFVSFRPTPTIND